MEPVKTDVFGYARDFLKFCRMYRDFLRHPISLAQAQSIVAKRLEERGANFLRMVGQNVFANPKSPYLPLMQAAHCEIGDLERMVSAEGLERTLLALRRDGVYISYEEYKGRTPMVRNGREIPIAAGDFRNTNLAGVLDAETGGSTGVARRIGFHIDHIAALAPARMLAFEAHGMRTAPLAVWMGVLPDAGGLVNILRAAKYGQVAEKWFANVVMPERFRHRFKAGLHTRAIIALGRLGGVPIPAPEPLPLDQALVVAEWVSTTLKSHARCVLYGHVSKGLRVAVAAEKAGLDLTGAVFVLGGEPVTPGKVAAIARSGAATMPLYVFSEHGEIGLGCANPVAEDEIHLHEDTIEIIQFPRKARGTDIVVDAFHWTSLSPTAPNVLLNVESDDFGIVEERACGCAMDAFGFKKHIREIRSYQKLTGEGVTLIGSDAIRALEEVLPARFGGSPLDYQLVEEEDDDGLTRVSLVVDPSVSIESEQGVIDTFVEATGYHSLGQVWSPVNTLRVKRQKPVLTSRGKLMPLRLLK